MKKLLSLEYIEENIYRGVNFEVPWGRIYGGQVLSQALNAAYMTVPEGSIAHSLHAYFILEGDLTKPVVYEVERIRNGRSFTTRRVVAIQKGRPIFNFSASFQIEEAGYEHQIEMPDIPGPENLIDEKELLSSWYKDVPLCRKKFIQNFPFDIRPVNPISPNIKKALPSVKHIWMKNLEETNFGISYHQQALAFISDYHLISTTILPHKDKINSEKMFFTSLDHAMWFHREFKSTDWLLYSLDSPSTCNSRGLARGFFFTQEGKLVATVIQEGLIRRRR